MNNLKNIIKSNQSNVLLFSAIAIAVAVFGVAIADTESIIPEESKLKVSKDKILFSREHGDMTEYLYVSDVEVKPAAGEDVSKRTKNAQFFNKGIKDNKEYWEAVFYTGEPFYKDDIENKWYQTETDVIPSELFVKQMEPTIMDKIAALFSDKVIAGSTNIYSGSGDGVIKSSTEGSASWDTQHDEASGGGGAGPTANIEWVGTYSENTDYNRKINRTFFPIDTSALDDGVVINSATLYVYNNQAEQDYGGGFYLVQTSQASNTTLTADDYDECGAVDSPTTGGYLDATGMPEDYNSWSLDSTGLTWVSKMGYTKLGMRSTADVDDSDPGASKSDSFVARFSEYTGTDYDPKLVVTYIIPSTDFKVRKFIDESISNSTTLQVDDELVLSLDTHAVYLIDGVIFASSTSVSPDIKIAFDTPDAGSWETDIGFLAASDAFRHGEMLQGDKTESGRIDIITPDTPIVIQVKGTVVTDSTAGDLKLYWAQATSDASATKVLEGSYLRADRIE